MGVGIDPKVREKFLGGMSQDVARVGFDGDLGELTRARRGAVEFSHCPPLSRPRLVCSSSGHKLSFM